VGAPPFPEAGESTRQAAAAAAAALPPTPLSSPASKIERAPAATPPALAAGGRVGRPARAVSLAADRRPF